MSSIRCPRLPPPLVPYIYSQSELKQLLDATPLVCSQRTSFDAVVLRHLILLLYGACLRLGEGLHLTVKDVDLNQAILCIRQSKFYKTRLVPLDLDLNAALQRYMKQYRLTYTSDPDTPFFCCRDGTMLSKATVESAFRRLRHVTGIKRYDDARYQPRLHDLRHTGAICRLIAWYRRGSDINYLLPQLAT